MPLEWVGFREAVRLYHLEQVAYTCGTLLYCIHGGISAYSGRRSSIEVNSIIATYGRNHALVLVEALGGEALELGAKAVVGAHDQSSTIFP